MKITTRLISTNPELESGFVDNPGAVMFMKYIKQSPIATAADASLVYLKDCVAVSDFPDATGLFDAVT